MNGPQGDGKVLCEQDEGSLVVLRVSGHCVVWFMGRSQGCSVGEEGRP